MYKFEEVAEFFGVESDEIKELLSNYEVRSLKRIFRKTLWKLIVAGADQDSSVVDETMQRYQKVRNKRYRTQVSYGLKNKILERDNKTCRYCGKKVNKNTMTLDHVVPWSRGGRNQEYNLVVCCRKCNFEKREMLLSEWNHELYQYLVNEGVIKKDSEILVGTV